MEKRRAKQLSNSRKQGSNRNGKVINICNGMGEEDDNNPDHNFEVDPSSGIMFSPRLFDEALNEVMKLMKQNCWGKFTRLLFEFSGDKELETRVKRKRAALRKLLANNGLNNGCSCKKLFGTNAGTGTGSNRITMSTITPILDDNGNNNNNNNGNDANRSNSETPNLKIASLFSKQVDSYSYNTSNNATIATTPEVVLLLNESDNTSGSNNNCIYNDMDATNSPLILASNNTNPTHHSVSHSLEDISEEEPKLVPKIHITNVDPIDTLMYTSNSNTNYTNNTYNRNNNTPIPRKRFQSLPSGLYTPQWTLAVPQTKGNNATDTNNHNSINSKKRSNSLRDIENFPDFKTIFLQPAAMDASASTTFADSSLSQFTPESLQTTPQTRPSRQKLQRRNSKYKHLKLFTRPRAHSYNEANHPKPLQIGSSINNENNNNNNDNNHLPSSTIPSLYLPQFKPSREVTPDHEYSPLVAVDSSRTRSQNKLNINSKLTINTNRYQNRLHVDYSNNNNNNNNKNNINISNRVRVTANRVNRVEVVRYNSDKQDEKTSASARIHLNSKLNQKRMQTALKEVEQSGLTQFQMAHSSSHSLSAEPLPAPKQLDVSPFDPRLNELQRNGNNNTNNSRFTKRYSNLLPSTKISIEAMRQEKRHSKQLETQNGVEMQLMQILFIQTKLII